VAHAQNKHVDFRWRYGDDPQTPVEYLLKPSYAIPETIMILGREVGLSGVIDPGGGAYGINSDIYHLKVLECSAQLYVNEGLGHPYNTAVMQRILNRLEEEVFELEYGTGTLGNTIMQKRPSSGYKSKAELKRVLGKHYDKFKDLLCIHTWSDGQVCNPVPLSEEAIDAYHRQLLHTRPIDKLTGERITRYGRGKTKTGEPNRAPMLFYGTEPDRASTTDIASTSIYGLDELNPCYIEITSRAPVNINTAPREILVALLKDLEGFYLLEQSRALPCAINLKSGWYTNLHEWCYTTSHDYATGELGVLLRTPRIEQTTAQAIATEIINRRNLRPFTTWHDFNTFIDGLVGSIIHDTRGAEFFLIYKDKYLVNPENRLNLPNRYRQLELLQWAKISEYYQKYADLAIADTIKANFNPNLHLNELNPDANLWQLVDKTDLIKNSTEFCFLPTGYFQIESVGQILRPEWEEGKFHISPYLIISKDSFTHNNQIMGQRRLKVEVKLWDLYRDTTQADFYRLGRFSPNSAPQYPAQYNQSCMSMPEPDNGPAPFENN
jgi:hypothetical protein